MALLKFDNVGDLYMEKKRKIAIASILIIITLVSAFSLDQLFTEPQIPNLSSGGQEKLTVQNRTLAILWPYNNSASIYYGYKNISSSINVTFYSSHATFSIFPVLWDPSFVGRQVSSGLCVVSKKISQGLQTPVSNFTFEIKDFTILLNNSLFYGGVTMTSNDIYIVTSHSIVFALPPTPWPFSFTMGNISNVNSYYFVNYSFQFVPIVEIGFLHFNLKPVSVRNSYVAPWGFKKPPK